LPNLLRFGFNICMRPKHSFYYPEFLKAEITTGCNMSCRFCGAANSSHAGRGRSGRHMDLTIFKKIIQNIPKLRWIDLQGVGEPLVHPFFTDIIKLLTRKSISTQFTTNGTLLKGNVIESITKGAVHSVTISMSAASPEKYLKIHGADRYAQVIQNIARLVKMKRINKPRLRMLAVVMSTNLGELNRLVDTAKDVGIDTLVLSAYKQIYEGDPNIPDHKELRKAIAGVKNHAKAVGFPIEIEVPIADIETIVTDRGISAAKCMWPWTGLAVDVGGEVMPCCYSMGNHRYNLGNLAIDKIYKIFNNHGYRQLRTALNRGNTDGLVCHFCNDHVG